MEEEAGVWVRLLDDRILTPSQFNALTAEDCKTRVQFVPVPFDNEDIGERIDDLQHGEEHIPLSHRVSVVGDGDGDMSFTVLDKRTNHYVSKEEMLSNDGPYGPPGDARRSDLVFWGYPCDLIDDEQGIESVHESARLLELDQLIVTQLRRRIYEWPPPPIAPTRALIDAVDALDGARIRDVLECDGPFNITHDFFAAVLLRSLPRDRTNVMAVKALLDAGVDDLTSPVDDNNPQWAAEDITPGATPFFAACTYGRLDCALLILERERAMARARADATPILSLDVPLQSGATPLHFCCQNGAELTARFLIAQRADLSKTRGTGGGPLFAACQNGFPRLVAILLAAKASVDHGMWRTGTTPLMAACMTGKTETVEMLLEAGADVTAVALDGHTAHSLTKAAGAQHAAGQRGISEAEEIAVTRLLEEGVSEPKLHVGDRVLISGLRGRPDLNSLGAVVHSYLQERGRYRVEVEQLDEAVALKRQNIELIPGLPFMEPRDFNMLLFNGQAYACEVFVRNGHVSKLALDAIYVGRTGTEGSLLVHASLCLTSGRADLVKALLDANANACGTNIGRSATPLMAACQFGRLEVVEMLLAHGAAATIDADNAVSGLPPALMQCFIIGERAAHMDINRDESKLLDCARMLIAHGADISRVDSAGYSNLMAAAQWGNEGAVRLLLEKRAEVNYSNACEGPGFSALMAALAEGHVECVRALIDAGADTTLTWSGGSSGTSVPLDAQGIAKLRRSHRTTLWGPVRYDLCLEALTEFDRSAPDITASAEKFMEADELLNSSDTELREAMALNHLETLKTAISRLSDTASMRALKEARALRDLLAEQQRKAKKQERLAREKEQKQAVVAQASEARAREEPPPAERDEEARRQAEAARVMAAANAAQSARQAAAAHQRGVDAKAARAVAAQEAQEAEERAARERAAEEEAERERERAAQEERQRQAAEERRAIIQARKARKEAERRSKAEAEAAAAREAEQQAREEAELQLALEESAREAEEQARREAEERVRLEEERRAALQRQAQTVARAEAQRRAEERAAAERAMAAQAAEQAAAERAESERAAADAATVQAAMVALSIEPQPSTSDRSPPSRTEDSDESNLCVVCMEEANTHILVPCGHQCVCAACSQIIGNTMCPVCREPVQMAMKVYK